jgi:hypothetical protein
MASPNLQENGIGGTSGDDLVTLAPLRTSGDIWYVDFTNGTDAASPAGKDRIKPIKTLSQAYTNAAAGDTIVFLSGHAETLTATQTIAKAGLKLISEATGSNRARFTSNISVAAIMFDITAAGVMLGNLYFVQSTVANATARVRYTSTAGNVRNCYFECGTADTVAALAFGSSSGQCAGHGNDVHQHVHHERQPAAFGPDGHVGDERPGARHRHFRRRLVRLVLVRLRRQRGADPVRCHEHRPAARLGSSGGHGLYLHRPRSQQERQRPRCADRMRTIGRHYVGPRRNWAHACDYCGVTWLRSELTIDSEGLYSCPDDRDGRTAKEIDVLRAEAASEPTSPQTKAP